MGSYKKYSKEDQKILATWALDCAERVLPLFEAVCPNDDRPQKAIQVGREWVRTGFFAMAVIRKASLDAHAAARDVNENEAACFAAHAAGQAVATAHVTQHAYGVSYYALKAIAAANPQNAKRKVDDEVERQTRALPEHLRKEIMSRIIVDDSKGKIKISIDKSEATNIFIFHGTEGHPKENWFPWLKVELEAKGYNIIVPQFPSPPVVTAKIAEWFDVLKDYEKYINEDTVIVGHSLGGVFTLRVLEKLDHPVKAAIFVGAPIGVRPILNYDRDNGFSGFNFDWDAIRGNAKNFVVYQSDDDPYVGLDNGKELAKHLGVELSFVPNAGHFNRKAGYTEFADLRDKLLNILGEA